LLEKVDANFAANLEVTERGPGQQSPIMSSPEGRLSRLLSFTAQPESVLTVLGPRRIPRVEASTANSDKSIAVCTSFGFRTQLITDYISAAGTLEPDIFVAPADIPNAEKWGSNRSRKLFERTGSWLEQAVKAKASDPTSNYALFASIVQLPELPQKFFLKEVAEAVENLSGLAIHAPAIPPDLPDELIDLPRLYMNDVHNPAEVLKLIADGIDLFSAPFINYASDAGFALTFSFPAPAPAPSNSTKPIPLAINLWPVEEHSFSIEPLVTDCQCMACTKHHRAYLQHLLAAKEMYGWVLLQVHNYHIFNKFLEGVRKSIAENGSRFANDVLAFNAYYDNEMPAQTGQGPR
jgi:queuine tRNA-ribosyltransferase subunit QTRTD1